MYEKKGPIYNYQMREMDGKDQRSIIERWGDKNPKKKKNGGEINEKLLILIILLFLTACTNIEYTYSAEKL